VGLFRVDEVDGGGDLARPLAAAAVGEVERLVQGSPNTRGAEPDRNIAYSSAIGIVEVVAGGEELDRLGAGFVEGVEQAGMKALLEKDMGGKGRLHHLLKYSSWGIGG
jgi:hypothetical protein